MKHYMKHALQKRQTMKDNLYGTRLYINFSQLEKILKPLTGRQIIVKSLPWSKQMLMAMETLQLV